MPLLAIVLGCAAVLVVAYFTYGSLLARLLRLDPFAATPAQSMRDDVDYVPTPPRFLLGQHFSAIAAAGPVVGPILAGAMFGWGPALAWILLGSIFIGGVHDLASLVASVRHKARCIPEVVREHMSARSYVLFLLFVWIALVYIVVAFTDIVAGSFLGAQALDDGTVVTGGGIATSSILYLALPLAMGLLLRFTKLPLGWATVIFLPLVAAAIWLGQKYPFDLAAALDVTNDQARCWWNVILLAYCFVASIVPVWALLQPRGHLGGYFLYAALAACAVGLVIGAFRGNTAIEYPAFLGWQAANGATLAPILFITIACGACSGFHCLIASGTTSKQLGKETDAKVIGYGAMLLEAMVAIVSLACLMLVSPEIGKTSTPNHIYARGIGSFVAVLGIPAAVGVSFGLLAFTTFVYDTLDVCTRLGRYIIQELAGWQGWAGRAVATAITAGVPLVFLLRTPPLDAAGRPIPVWRTFWPLFGASNQLLAALALVGITVWLWRTYRAKWIWLVAGLPTVFMYAMSGWALVNFVRAGFIDPATSAWRVPTDPVPWVALLLLALAGLLLIEAILVFLGRIRPPTGSEVAASQAIAAA